MDGKQGRLGGCSVEFDHTHLDSFLGMLLLGLDIHSGDGVRAGTMDLGEEGLESGQRFISLS